MLYASIDLDFSIHDPTFKHSELLKIGKKPPSWDPEMGGDLKNFRMYVVFKLQSS